MTTSTGFYRRKVGRPHRLEVRLSDDEHATLKAIAAKAKRPRGSLMVETFMAAASRRADPLVLEEIRSLQIDVQQIRTEINALGHNFNQLTKLAHTGAMPYGADLGRIGESLGRLAIACEMMQQGTSKWLRGQK